MGCSEKNPKKQKNNPNDKLNSKITIPDACGLAGTASNSLSQYIPDNGEYEWAGEGSGCHYSSRNPGRAMSCSAGCTGPVLKLTCSIAGKKGTYKRTSYKANEKDCCLGKGNPDGTLGKYTCHPDARTIHSSRCIPYLKKLCESNDNIFKKANCINFCGKSQNNEFCDSQKIKYCNSSDKLKNNKNCTEWCKINSKKCASGIQDYCSNSDNLFTKNICTDYCTENTKWCKDASSIFCDSKNQISTNQHCYNWCKSNKSNCENGIKQFCTTKNNLWESNLCTDFCTLSKNKNWCNDQKSKYCNSDTNIKSEKCQNWCMSNMGLCDAGMRSFCKIHPKHDNCACINSAVSKYNPLCVDTHCTTKGYATNTMISAKGSSCNIVDCSQYLNLKDAIAGGNIELVPSFEQKCGSVINNEKNTDKSTEKSESSKTEKTTANESRTITKSNIQKKDSDKDTDNLTVKTQNDSSGNSGGNVGGIIFFVIIFIVLFFAVIYAYSSKGSKKSRYYR